MKRWNASMPRAEPKPGQSFVVVAFSCGAKRRRMEFEGQLSHEDAQTLMNTAIEMSKKTKE